MLVSYAWWSRITSRRWLLEAMNSLNLEQSIYVIYRQIGCKPSYDYSRKASIGSEQASLLLHVEISPTSCNQQSHQCIPATHLNASTKLPAGKGGAILTIPTFSLESCLGMPRVTRNTGRPAWRSPTMTCLQEYNSVFCTWYVVNFNKA